MNVVDFAWQIIEMNRTIREHEQELMRLYRVEEEYKKLLDSTLVHNQVMAGNMLKLLITPGVAETFIKNQESQ